MDVHRRVWCPRHTPRMGMRAAEVMTDVAADAGLLRRARGSSRREKEEEEAASSTVILSFRTKRASPIPDDARVRWTRLYVKES